MIRKAFRMSVHPHAHEEYEKRHRPIWKDLEETLIQHGVQQYSIFLDETTSDLFAYAEIASEDQWAAIAGTDVCQRWWQHMKELMPTNPDGSPKSGSLREVFHIPQNHS